MTGLRMDSRIYILLAVLIFLIPLKWLAAWLAAVCFHELFHFLVVKLYGGNIHNFSVALSGANMECTGLSDKSYLLSVLAGPVGGLALLLLGRWFPRLAICSWILSVYNLLPLLPLDGGRVLRLLLKDNAVFSVIQKILLLCISGLAVYLCFFVNFGPLPIAIALSLWFKNRKRPCKESLWGVQ